jgi:hypothetical protein
MGGPGAARFAFARAFGRVVWSRLACSRCAMRRMGLRFPVCLLALGLLAVTCDRPDFLELEPKSHTFARPGEDVWWKAVARTRQGKILHKVTVSWSSSDEKVVTVDAKGRVRAVGPGVAKVLARVGELSAEAAVEVVAVGKVTVEPTEGLTLEARGEGKPIVIKVYDVQGRPLNDRVPVARCQDENICRVFPDGVHGVDSGETRLLVKAEGATAEIPVKVLPTEEEKLAKGIGVDEAMAKKRREEKRKK